MARVDVPAWVRSVVRARSRLDAHRSAVACNDVVSPASKRCGVDQASVTAPNGTPSDPTSGSDATASRPAFRTPSAASG